MKKRKPTRQKFDATRRELFLGLLRKGIRRSNACIKVGISRATFSTYMNANPKFVEEVALAEYDSNELIEQAMFNTALKGNVTAQQVILYNRMPERWRDRRNIVLSGDRDSPIEMNIRTVADLVRDVSERERSKRTSE